MNFLKGVKHCLLISGFLFLYQSEARAQGNHYNDTAYYVYFPRHITGRIFFSQKYLAFSSMVKDAGDVHYQPNAAFALGAGVTWGNLSVNIAWDFGILKKRNEPRGKTTHLDLQMHYFTPKWATDLYGQVYTGFYLYPKGIASVPGNDYYYRPDVKVSLMGISRYRIFNSRRFSYRAAITQNEWQKRSAGSFLLGAEAYYGVVKADSSLVPRSIQEINKPSEINQINYASIGPGAGYAYTLVIAQHLFVTGSVTASLNFSYSTAHTGIKKSNHISVNPVSGYRVAAGYNSRLWTISGNWIAGNLPFKGVDPRSKYVFKTGNYRLVVAWRFKPGKKVEKHLRKMDKLFKEYSL